MSWPTAAPYFDLFRLEALEDKTTGVPEAAIEAEQKGSIIITLSKIVCWISTVRIQAMPREV